MKKINLNQGSNAIFPKAGCLFLLILFWIWSLPLESKETHERMSSLVIHGADAIACLPQEVTYFLAGDSLSEHSSTNYLWHWQVMGGMFDTGDREVVQEGTHPKPVHINWNPAYNGMGIVTFRVKAVSEGGKQILVGEVSKTVRLGLPRHIEITREEGVFKCEGNWYLLKIPKLTELVQHPASP